jgi:hypothetical protein
MIIAKDIELFKNLAELNYDDQYYDFHNDYDCQKILFENEEIILVFKNIVSEKILLLKFKGVFIEKMDFFNVSNIEYLTIDNLYRGKVEIDGSLIDISDNGKAYFYLEFYEGQKIEFWAIGISLVNKRE